MEFLTNKEMQKLAKERLQEIESLEKQKAIELAKFLTQRLANIIKDGICESQIKYASVAIKGEEYVEFTPLCKRILTDAGFYFYHDRDILYMTYRNNA